MNLRRFSMAVTAAALALAAPAPLHAVNDPPRLTGYLGGYWTRNYFGPIAIAAPVWGEDLNANLDGSLVDRRLLRYSLGVDVIDGRTYGVEHQVRALGTGARLGFRLLPESWYQFGLYGGASRLRVDDGPAYSLVSTERLLGADMSLRTPMPWAPQVYTRFEEGRSQMSRAAFAELRRRDYTLRLWKNVSRTTIVEADYDLLDSRYLGTPLGSTSHRVYLSSLSQVADRTVFTARADNNWYYADAGPGARSLFRSAGFGTQLVTFLTPDDEVQATQSSSAAWGAGTSTLGTDVQALYAHRFAPWLRSRTGAEFAHFATDSTALGFGYQKFREAALGGAELNVPVGIVEIAPIYLGAFGAVQLDQGAGGSYVRHDASLPVRFGFEGTPLVVAGQLRHERDNSDVRVFRRYRALTARIDVFDLAVARGADATRVWLEALRGRSDSALATWRTREDETRGGVNADTRLSRLRSNFNAGYSYGRRVSLENDLRTHVVAGGWDFAPWPSLFFTNHLEYSSTRSPGQANVDRVLWYGGASYRWRAMELAGNVRYDDRLGSSEDDQWGAYVFIRRYFGLGSGT